MPDMHTFVMKKSIILVFLIISLQGCTNNSQVEPLDITATPQTAQVRPGLFMTQTLTIFGTVYFVSYIGERPRMEPSMALINWTLFCSGIPPIYWRMIHIKRQSTCWMNSYQLTRKASFVTISSSPGSKGTSGRSSIGLLHKRSLIRLNVETWKYVSLRSLNELRCRKTR